jgi:probable rRNA maturation factor
MMIAVEVQRIVTAPDIPGDAQLDEWVNAAVQGAIASQDEKELVVRIVDEEESRELNHRYRGNDNPTNVLSFPFEAPAGVPCVHLGDLVVCAPVVEREAREQDKPLEAHWAHMIVHGVLHLMGYDHQNDSLAGQMEHLEAEILSRFGVPDPYEER